MKDGEIDAEMNAEFALFVEAVDTGLEPQRYRGSSNFVIKDTSRKLLNYRL